MSDADYTSSVTKLSRALDLVRYTFACHRVWPPREPSVSLDPYVRRHPVFSLGVVADVQYARLRTHRSATYTARRSVRRRRAWCDATSRARDASLAMRKADVDAIASLGDLVEGYSHPDIRTDAAALADVARVTAALGAGGAPVWHVIGNHCRAALPRHVLRRALALSHGLYYARVVAPGWRVIVLNTAELCAAAVDADRAEHTELARIVRAERRPKHGFHGALSDTQLYWLATQLDMAKQAKQRVIVLSHYPLADGAARRSHVLANTRAVRALLDRDDTPVVACLAGHDHLGGMRVVGATDRRGPICYITFPAMLEATRKRNEFAIVTAFSDGSLKVNNGFDSSLIYALDASRSIQ